MKKIAFCFLIYDKINLEEYWNYFFDKVDKIYFQDNKFIDKELNNHYNKMFCENYIKTFENFTSSQFEEIKLLILSDETYGNNLLCLSKFILKFFINKIYLINIKKKIFIIIQIKQFIVK